MFAYGPVPSRRLGRSIGVSPIPAKTCTYSCVYCQLGRTDHLQFKRCSFFPKEDILEDLSKVVAQSEADYITFVGDGEPTLNQDLGWLIRKTKELWKIPVAVITNGSLLFLKEVRHELNAADVVLPTLDAGNEATFRLINRPHPQIKFAKMIDGLINFRHEYSGQLWLEIMLVKGLNDHSEALRNIRQAVDLISPDRVYVSIPIRPPAEKWVKPPEPGKVLAAQQILGNVEYIIEKETGDFGINEFKDAREAILETAYRHPLREAQALTIEKRFQQGGILQNMIEAREVVKYDYQNDMYILPAKLLRGAAKSY
jgi:wyosine [tRNA(Phe)-imidazoG37] synthetase (radical SAM superfamily)